MMWLVLSAMFGCASSGPEAYAGCTVTVVTVQPFGDSVQEETLLYDAEGRLVASRAYVENSFYPNGASGRAEYTNDGDCVVERRYRSENAEGSALSGGRLTRVCDEHGHQERVKEESWLEPWSDGHAIVTTSGYENRHDAQGRLVAVTKDNGLVTEHQWGAACEDPVETRYSGTEGFTATETRVCNLAGKGIEGEYEGLDPEGVRYDYHAWHRAYDTAGRLLSEEYDRGPGTDIYQRITYAYDDATAPGPTEVTTEYEGEISEVVTYTYDCEG